MRPRTDVLRLFSTFIQFSDDRFDAWLSDPRLLKNISRQLERQRTANQSAPLAEHQQENQCNQAQVSESLGSLEENWEQLEKILALYWHAQSQKQTKTPENNQKGRSGYSYPVMHLCSYLQEPCYWAAEQVNQRFGSAQFTVADGFQSAIAKLDRILSGYSPDYGSSLKTYARTAFGNIIRDHLRQQKTTYICSDWGLLRRLSQTQLKQALLRAGFQNTDADLLVWKCFKAVCVPEPGKKVKSLAAPSPESLAEMADRYNQLRTRFSPVLAPITVPLIEASLSRSIKAGRAYLSPGTTSLNQSSFDSGTELQSTLSAAAEETPMAQLMAREAYVQQQTRLGQIEQVILAAIADLDPNHQTLLRLYYQNQFTQKEIAQQLNLKQYQVSRQLSRIRQKLLTQLVTWSQNNLHISLKSPVIADISEVIHEWLQQHYHQLETPTSSASAVELGASQ